jgi:hypothetical protein
MLAVQAAQLRYLARFPALDAGAVHQEGGGGAVPVVVVQVLVTEHADSLAADRGLPRVHLFHRGQQLGDALAGELGHVHAGQELHRGPH